MYDNVKRTQYPVFAAIFYSMGAFGPACGFLVASFSLALYWKPWAPPAGVGESSPEWVGAWWIGMAICGTLTALSGIALWFYPSRLPRRFRPDWRVDTASTTDQCHDHHRPVPAAAPQDTAENRSPLLAPQVVGGAGSICEPSAASASLKGTPITVTVNADAVDQTGPQVVRTNAPPNPKADGLETRSPATGTRAEEPLTDQAEAEAEANDEDDEQIDELRENHVDLKALTEAPMSGSIGTNCTGVLP